MKIPPACRKLSQAHWSIQMDPSQMIVLFLCREYYKLVLHLLKSVFVSLRKAWGLKSVLLEFYCAIVSFLQSSKYTNRSLQGNSHVLSRYERGINCSLEELMSLPRLEEGPQEAFFHYLSSVIPIPSATQATIQGVFHQAGHKLASCTPSELAAKKSLCVSVCLGGTTSVTRRWAFGRYSLVKFQPLWIKSIFLLEGPSALGWTCSCYRDF